MAGNLRGVDVWFDGHLETLTTALVDTTTNTHGTGTCCSDRSQSCSWQWIVDVSATSKEYVTTALTYALDIGKGSGPVDTFSRSVEMLKIEKQQMFGEMAV